MIRITQTNYGKGINRTVYDGDKLIATIHSFTSVDVVYRESVMDRWNVCWTTGRVDWHPTLAEARDNALKGL